MIAFLRGKLVEKSPSRLVIDVGGVGYELTVSLATYDAVPGTGAECSLLVYEKIAEDSYTLYGFATAKERELFSSLVSVGGVGPKIAIGALSGMTVNDLTVSIAKGDVKRISSLHGIGKKTAERIVVELKDKIRPMEVLVAENTGGNRSGVVRDASLALGSLGFSEEEASRLVRLALEELSTDATPEELLRQALKMR